METVADLLLDAIGHQRACRTGQAAASYRRVLRQDPAQPEALYLFGLLKLTAGEVAPAADLLGRAAVSRPFHLGTRLHLSRALLGAGHPVEALAEAEAALALDPAASEAQFLRGTALGALDRPAEAIDSLRQVLASVPGHAGARLNLGNAYADFDALADAEVFCRAAIEADPTLVEAQASLGFVLTSQGRLEEAMAACRRAVALDPDYAPAHFNLAVAALLAGDFAIGWHEYEWRKRHDRFRRDFVDLSGPIWNGEPLAGRTILVQAEQGCGDTIQLARYLPEIVRAGGRPVLACDAALVPLLSRLAGVRAVGVRAIQNRPDSSNPRLQKHDLPKHDLWIDQMSLPRVFATEADEIPGSAGYLRADPARAAFWRERLPAGRPRIGLVWAGNPAHANDRRRSLPPAALAPILVVPGCRFLGLQTGPAAQAGPDIPDLSAALTDYGETAAILANFDLLVSVDTSAAHVAGALGVPCWVMLPFAPDWRWRLGRDDTPWYDSLRLFRQSAPGDWAGVARRVADALRQLFAT